MFKLIHYSRSGEEIFEFNTEAELKAELKKIKHLNQKFEVDKELAEDGTLDYIAITTNHNAKNIVTGSGNLLPTLSTPFKNLINRLCFSAVACFFSKTKTSLYIYLFK